MARYSPQRGLVLGVAGTLLFASLLLASLRLGSKDCDGLLCFGLASPRLMMTEASDCAACHDTQGPATSNSSSPGEQDRCLNFPDTSNVLVIMKTGASEAFGKVPTQLLTALVCVKNYLFFSDMHQEIAGHVIYDSLDEVLPEAKEGNPDFNIYNRQQQCQVDADSCNKGMDTAAEGWQLDKYKNIHMAEKTYHMQPHHDWYMFVDADTYVVWPSLMTWLGLLDPRKGQYLGSTAYYKELTFGHGGSGYLLSNPAMRDLFADRTGVANQWDVQAKEECCGDVLFAMALRNDTGLEVSNMWPTINGEKPHSFAYGPDQWCQPLVTMHHVNSEEVAELNAFELERGYGAPILRIKDLFFRFVQPRLEENREDWDNLSDDVLYVDAGEFAHPADPWEMENAKRPEDFDSPLETTAHRSVDECSKACESQGDCLQYRFRKRGGVCALSRTIRHGKPVPQTAEREERWMSGWNMERIEAWVAANEDCGSRIGWPSP